MTDLHGKRALVTGGNAGIGLETAVALARMGASVTITSRDAGRGARAREEIAARSGNASVEVAPLDLASLTSVRSCAARELEVHDRLDILVNNAGLLHMQRRVTPDGFEETFGVNHLGHFLLTTLLLDRLAASAPARVVVVASEAHRTARHGLPFDDLQSTRHYRGFQAYSRSKLANLLFVRELARRTRGSGVTANAVHPGYVRSRFARDGDIPRVLEPIVMLGGALFAVSPEKGARTSVYVASSPGLEGVTGDYFVRRRPREPSAAARDDAAAARLWELSEALVGHAAV